jgi:hypothetical protein
MDSPLKIFDEKMINESVISKDRQSMLNESAMMQVPMNDQSLYTTYQNEME